MRAVQLGLVVAVTLILSGCWIKIIVPAGGTVSSTSGNYFCTESEPCDAIWVGDENFDETFVATAPEGYIFSSWKRQSEGLCNGTRGPCRLFTSFFKDTPLMSFLERQDTYLLTPVFCKENGWSDPLLFLAPNFDVKLTRNVVFGTGPVRQPEVGDKDLVLDILEPVCGEASPGEKLRPAIITIHGGAFEHGNKADDLDDAFAFASRGYVALSINYRLKGDDPPDYPDVAPETTLVAAAQDDTLKAIGWVIDNAQSLGIDPNRIALYGRSAGAITALLTGMALDIIADGSGPFDLTFDPRQYRLRAVVAFWTSVDWLTSLITPGDPAVFTFHFTQDQVTPASPEQLDAFEAALTAARIDHEVHRFEAEAHGGRMVWTPVAQNVYQFLYRNLDLDEWQ